MSAERFHANGIDGATGAYLLPELTPAEVAAAARGEPVDAVTRELKRRQLDSADHYGVPDDADPDDLGDTGWGIVFAKDADPAIREALAPLIELRRAAASAKNAARFRVLEGDHGVRAAQSKNDWLIENGGVPGECDPDRMPYYLLIVGSPEAIPFEFQYQLDVQHAVGRLHFEKPEDYARYAQTVIDAEGGKIARTRRLAMLGPRNTDDDATTLSADVLLAELLAARDRITKDWALDAIVGDGATKACFAAHFGGAQTPAIVFTASHGMGFPSGDARQARHQGALLAQDWPGPVEHRGRIPESMYFSADDLSADADVRGLIAFCFACYGAGTPARDQFSRADAADIRTLAPQPFVSPLARAPHLASTRAGAGVRRPRRARVGLLVQLAAGGRDDARLPRRPAPPRARPPHRPRAGAVQRPACGAVDRPDRPARKDPRRVPRRRGRTRAPVDRQQRRAQLHHRRRPRRARLRRRPVIGDSPWHREHPASASPSPAAAIAPRCTTSARCGG